MGPTVLYVPGFWEGVEPFQQVASLLSAKNIAVATSALRSTGTSSPGNPSMHDDITTIRSSVETLTAEDKEIVMVLHSAGRFLGSNAIEGLTAKARTAKGLKGGVVGIVFLTGAIFPVGYKHQPLPFAEFKDEDGTMWCKNVKEVLFNDLDSPTAEEWIAKLKSQPATGWDGEVTYCGWQDVPSFYLVCEGDQAIPPPLQVQLGESAGSKIEKCAAGHMVMLSMPEKVSAVIEGALAAF